MSPTVIACIAAFCVPAIVFALAVLLWGYIDPLVLKPWLITAISLFVFVVAQQAFALVFWLVSVIPPVEWPAHDVRETYNMRTIWRELGASAMAALLCIRMLVAIRRDAAARTWGRAANDEA